MSNLRVCRLSWCTRRYRIQIALCMTIILASVVILMLRHKMKETHARRLGPRPAVAQQNHVTAKLLRKGVLNGGNESLDLHTSDLHGLEAHELEKELKLLLLLKRANISVNNILAKMNYSLMDDKGRKKYRLRADVRKALELRTLNGIKLHSGEQACHIPELDPFDESLKQYLKQPEPLKCKGTMLTDIKNKQLVLRKSVTKTISYKYCSVSSVQRVSDFSSIVSSPIQVKIERKQPKLSGGDILLQRNLTTDFTIVGCLDKQSRISEQEFDKAFTSINELDAFYHANPRLFDVHARIIPRPEVLHRLQHAKPPADGLGLNVVMLVLESTSRMNFMRQLPETQEVLKELGAVVLEGYNVVGDGTVSAVIPMLTGKTQVELPEVRKGHPDASFVDSYPMIWKEFAKNGYATMYAEDAPNMNTFTLRFNGFDEQPTDHYMRPLWTAVKEEDHCLGPTPVHNVMLDYLLDYMTEYKDMPHFAFSFLVGLTHYNINNLELMDSGLSWFLTNAKSLGLINNTVFVLLGDHGSRYASIRRTLQGKLEERLPLLSITLPKWMSKQHPDIVANLLKNRKRLITPFDVHETLQSVLHYNPTSARRDQRGLSLFSEIPRERTCDQAHIAPHWCTCLTWEPANLQKTNQVGEALVRNINMETEQHRDMCAKLSLSLVLHAERMVPSKKVLRFVNSDPDVRIPAFNEQPNVASTELPTIYRVTVETTPGNAIYEGTVKVLPQSNGAFLAYQSTGDISRINSYAKQGDCVRTLWPVAMPFCHCRNS